NPEAVGRLVLNHLIARTAEHGSVLLVLDNVDTPSLLSDPQLGTLPAHPRLHVAATTRLGEADFAGSSRLAPIRIEGLSRSESVSLLRSWREFATPDDEAAAHELAELLDGFTLAVEQAAVHLATRPDLRVRTYLDHLKARGLTRTDALTGKDERARMEHQESSLSLVLESALASLEKTVPGALTVLGLAAAMPPEAIAWPWLESIVRAHYPELAEPTDDDLEGAWPRIRRTLHSRGLIGDGRYPGITGRMHRLIAAHLAPAHTPAGNPAALVDEHAISRAEQLSKDRTIVPELWEVDALLDALPRPLAANPDNLERFADFFAFVAQAHVTDSRASGMLGELLRRLAGTHSRLEALAQTVLALMLEHQDPTLYQESLQISRTLATTQPGNLQVLWGLGVAAARIALLTTDSGEASALWLEAATSFRAALAIQPDHPQLARMSHRSALDYAETNPPDRDEWVAYAAALAERFGFE
ncbi:MAG: hypothetical protein Q4B08_14730, partial [Propionibacteriaceae bacterium]|nr:hypothetical protein [Propionibacteriaceae bacterium]